MNDKPEHEGLQVPAISTGRVYVLRVWHEGGEPPIWRALVREGHLGERQYFASVDACLEHLYAELLRR